MALTLSAVSLVMCFVIHCCPELISLDISFGGMLHVFALRISKNTLPENRCICPTQVPASPLGDDCFPFSCALGFVEFHRDGDYGLHTCMRSAACDENITWQIFFPPPRIQIETSMFSYYPPLVRWFCSSARTVGLAFGEDATLYGAFDIAHHIRWVTGLVNCLILPILKSIK